MLYRVTPSAITVLSSHCRCSYGTWINTRWSGSWRGTTMMWCLVSFHQMGHCWPRPRMTPGSSCGTTTRPPSCWNWGTTHTQCGDQGFHCSNTFIPVQVRVEYPNSFHFANQQNISNVFWQKKNPLDSDFSDWFEPYLRVFFRWWNVLSSHVMCPSAGDPEIWLMATVKASKLTLS